MGIGSGRLTLLPADGGQDQGAGRSIKVNSEECGHSEA